MKGIIYIVVVVCLIKGIACNCSFMFSPCLRVNSVLVVTAYFLVTMRIRFNMEHLKTKGVPTYPAEMFGLPQYPSTPIQTLCVERKD